MFTYMCAAGDSKVAYSLVRNVLFHLLNDAAPMGYGKGEAALDPAKLVV